MSELANRSALVLGGGGGIGLAIAEALVAANARVMIADINLDAVQAHAATLSAQGADVRAVRVDITDQASVDAAADATIAAFGGLHIGINSAGIAGPLKTIWDTTLEEWHRVISIDLWGAIHSARTFAPRILATGQGGHIVQVASMTAVAPQALVGAYGTAKEAILGLDDVLTLELAQHEPLIRVSTVFPGMILTPLNPLGTIAPTTVGLNVVDGIRNNREYIYTDDHFAREVRDRTHRLVAARQDILPYEEISHNSSLPLRGDA